MEPVTLCGAVACVAALAVVVHLLRHAVCRPQQDMTGKIVLLTGAGGGLGREMALELGRRGCPLALVDVVREANEETASQVRAAAAAAGTDLPVRTYTTDLSSRDAIKHLVQDVMQDFGHVDVLLSNAAILYGGGVCHYTDEEVDRMILVNLRATILLVRAVLPSMRARCSGQIVAVSSAAGVVPNHAMSLYGATKAGLTHFMECLYREMRMEGLEKDITITTIHPYFMGTFDLIVNASKVTGWLRWVTPFLEPAFAAKKAVESIARKEYYLFIPYHTKLGTNLVTVLPRCLRDFVVEKGLLLTFKYMPPYEYRHRKRDIHMVHEFLVKGFELFCDPAPHFQAMDEECAATGSPPPYDFAAHRERLEAFYRTQGKGVPAVVDKYIHNDIL